MNPEDLNILWLCRECGRSFAFHSDVEDHKRQFNHSMMMLCNLQGSDKALFTRGRMLLNFRVGGRLSQVTVEYEYYPSSGAINYVDVRYSDDALRSMVEEDPTMMKNIDNLIRKNLNQKLPVGQQCGWRD